MPETATIRRFALQTCLATALVAVVVAPAFADTAIVKLTGAEEAPAVDTDAFGECLVILNLERTELSVQCSHTALEPFAWHIHRGAVGVAGPIYLDPTPDPGTSPFEATFALDEEALGLLLTEQLYINVHTPEAPGGEVRGQIRMSHDFRDLAMTFSLDGDQETPPIESDFGGVCRTSLSPFTSTLLIACTHDVEDATAAHIHTGARGVAGGIDIDLGDASSPIIREIALDSAQVGRYLSGVWYVNVHSPANPGGEIRGQLDGCIESTATLCLANGRFEVQASFTDFQGQEHQGQAVKSTTNSGLFWFIDPSNQEMLIKVLDACAFNNRYWVFFAATTDVAFTLNVTDMEARLTKNYGNPLGQAADAVTDTDAFATCP
jgi:hypothetical protein